MAQYYRNSLGMVVDTSGNVVTDRTQLQQASGNAQGTDAAKVAISKLPEYKPQPSPMVQGGTIDASKVNVPSSVNTPAPTAPSAAEGFQVGLQGQVDTARTELEKTLKAERDAALKRQDELNKRLEAIQQESDPTKRATYEQEKTIIQNQLNAAETASATLEEDFTKRRSTVAELERLLTEGNDLVARAKNAPVSLSVLNKSVNRTIQDVQARAGVLQAVIAGVDGNIAQAHNIINTAQGTVRTYWQDQVEYNRAYLNLVNSGQLAKNKIHDDYANSQIALAENKLNQLEQTADYINKLMIDPQTAQFMADAGVTLNDSVEEINKKLAEQNRKNEVNDVINDLTLEGYKYVPFGQGRSDAVALEIAGETLYFVPPANILQAQAGKTSGGSSVTNFKLTSTQERDLLGAGFSATDIPLIQQSINENGVEATLAAVDNADQRLALAKTMNSTGLLSKVEAEPVTVDEAINSIVDTATDEQIKSLKTMADTAGVSSFWTGKKSDIKRLLNTAEMKQVIQDAIDQGLSTEDIIAALIS